MHRTHKWLATGAALAALGTVGAFTLGAVKAADLGGNCCADLEERVAELEATVAKKANRKVSLTIYGQVSKSVLWIDGSARDAVIGDNSNSPSRLGVKGTAKISPILSAGYVLEYGAADTFTVRHNYLWVEGPLGKVSLGHTSTATDGIAEVNLANTNIANLPTGVGAFFGASATYGAILDGERRNVIKLETPTLAGFTASVSWANADAMEAALRFVGEGGGFKFAAGLGYAENHAPLSLSLVDKRVSGSGSLMHVATGLFLNASAGKVTDLLLIPGIDPKLWHVTGGIERNWFGVGTTTIFGEYGKLSLLGESGDGFGGGMVQSINAAAMDVFVSYRSIEDVSIVHVGTRISF